MKPKNENAMTDGDIDAIAFIKDSFFLYNRKFEFLKSNNTLNIFP